MRIGIDVQTTLGQKSGFGFYDSVRISARSHDSEYRISAKPHLDKDKQ